MLLKVKTFYDFLPLTIHKEKCSFEERDTDETHTNNEITGAIICDWLRSKVSFHVWDGFVKELETRGFKIVDIRCPLCGKPSENGEVHKDCADYEQMMSDRY